MPADRSGGTEQNHDILRLHRSQSIPTADQRSLIQHIADLLRNKVCFFLIGIFPNFQSVKLRTGTIQRCMGNTFPQCFRFSISKTAHLRCHTGGKHIVYRLDHFRTGAEIVAEQNFSSLSGSCFLCIFVGMILLEENIGVRQTELIYGLLHVADHEAVVAFHSQRSEDRILHTVGILILVYHDLTETVADLQSRNRRTAAAFSQHKIQHFMLKIAEIQTSPAALGNGIIPFKGLNQRYQTSGTGAGLLQVTQHLFRRVCKRTQTFLQTVFARISCCFNALNHFRIIAFPGKCEPSVIDIVMLHYVVPCFAFTDPFKLMQNIFQVHCRLFHTRSLFQLLNAQLDHMNLTVQILFQIVHQVLTPDSFRSIRNLIHIRKTKGLLKPAIGVKVAHSTVINLLYQFRNKTVIPS